MLKSVMVTFATMKANTALGFLTAGLALHLLRPEQAAARRHRAGQLCGALVAILAILTLGEYLTGRSFGIDQLLFTDPDTRPEANPGRMAMATAWSFALIGIALTLLPVYPRLAQALAMAVLGANCLVLIGYVYDVNALYSVGPFQSVAVHTALAFSLLGAGMLAARPTVGVMTVLTSDSTGGAMARPLVPTVIIVPLVLGWFRLQGQRLGWYGTEFGLAIASVGNISVILTIVLLNAQALLHADRAFRQAADQVRWAVEAAPNAMVMTDRTGHIVLVNAQTELMFGYDRAELLDQPVELLLPERARAHHAQDVAAYAARPTTRAMGVGRDLFGRRKDGSEFPVEVGLNAIETPHGLRLLAAIVDITERKQAEEKFRLSVEAAPNAMVLVNPAGVIVLVNSHAEQMFGYARAELLGQTVELLVPERHRAAHVGHRGAFAAAPQARAMGFGHELFGRRKDGSEFPVEIGLNPLHTTEGLRILSAIVDITRRKRTESALRLVQERLQHVVTSSPAVIYSLQLRDDQVTSLWISDNVRTLLGCPDPAKLDQQWWLDNLHPDDRATAAASVPELLRHGQRHVSEYRFHHPDGSYRWFRDEKRLLRDAAGKPTECVGSWIDVTEQKQLENQFRQAQKMEAIGRLAGGIAHDFNNLLTVILGFSDLAIRHLKANDSIRQYVVEVKQAGERASLLTRQLLVFSRKQLVQPNVLELNSLVAEMDKMLRRLIGEDIELTFTPAPDLGQVLADPGHLEQVVMNLVVNARDAMPTGGRLTIETANVELDDRYVRAHAEVQAGEYILLAVSDTGCGMDAATRSRIFEPFFTTKGPEKGTGLGLATVFGICKQWGGHIEVYSEPDHGASFKVYLPRQRAATTIAAPLARPSAFKRGHETILLAEDEDAVRTLTKLVLEEFGYQVLEAANGASALKLCEECTEPIHLLISDVVMPHMSGRQLAERVVQARPAIKVFYLSGYTDDAVIRHGVLQAGTAFLQKPFTPAALLQKVREVLDR